MRGSDTAQSATTSYSTIFDTTAEISPDVPATIVGIESDEGNDARVIVKWTNSKGRVNFLSVKPGANKVFRSGKAQIRKIEIKSASGTQDVWFDLLGDEAF
jgi:hypothetical protein